MAADDAYEIGSYLPASFNTPAEQEYISFLWEAFEVNYANGKHQFAFLACHMLMMSFVYSKLWQIRKILCDDFNKSLLAFDQRTENRITAIGSPFGFSAAPEKTVMRFLKLIGCDYFEIGNYQKLVDERNDAAHANGTIPVNSQRVLDQKITQIIRAIDEIQGHSIPLIEESYKDFLVKSASIGRLYADERKARITEVLMRPNYFSTRDLEVCARFDITDLGSRKGFSYIRSLHQSLQVSLRE